MYVVIIGSGLIGSTFVRSRVSGNHLGGATCVIQVDSDFDVVGPASYATRVKGSTKEQ